MFGVKNMNRRVLFIHDGPRKKDLKGNIWGYSSDLELKERYSYLGGKVDFLMRIFSMEKSLENEMLVLQYYKIDVIGVPPFNRPRFLLNYYKASNIIKDTIKKYDILIIRLPSTIGSLSLKYAKKYKIPYLVEVVACPWDALWNYSVLGKLYAPFSFLKLRRNVKYAPFVIYVTNGFLQSRYPNYRQNIGISDVVIKGCSNAKLEYYAKMDTKNTYHIATLAAIDVPYKGQEFVIKAMSYLKGKGYNLVYHIAGGGRQDRLRKITNKLRLEANVVFEGLLKRDKVLCLLDSIDIYIQPSKLEGLPRALVEAMSRGCVCVGTDVGGIPELLTSEFVFKAGDVNEIISKIEQIIHSKDKATVARDNINKASIFQKDILDAKRNSFYDSFILSYFK